MVKVLFISKLKDMIMMVISEIMKLTEEVYLDGLMETYMMVK